MKRIVLDVDTGVDDALALLLALRSPELTLEAVTTVAGNVAVETATRNTRLVLELAQAPKELRVAEGAAQPLQRPLLTAAQVHGSDGLGNVTGVYPPPQHPLAGNEASDLLLEVIGEYGKELTIVATGPMTNLARAAQRDPERFRQVGEIVQMGGALKVRGNTSPVAEFNLYVDPEAAAVVLAAGVPLRLVPLDVTEQVILLRSELRRRALERDSTVFQFVREFTVLYFDFQQRMSGLNGGYLHDPTAGAAVIDPALLTWQPAQVEVRTDEAERGRTVATPTPDSSVQVATAVDAARVLELFCDRVCR